MGRPFESRILRDEKIREFPRIFVHSKSSKKVYSFRRDTSRPKNDQTRIDTLTLTQILNSLIINLQYAKIWKVGGNLKFLKILDCSKDVFSSLGDTCICLATPFVMQQTENIHEHCRH
jgi:hypothetical protein